MDLLGATSDELKAWAAGLGLPAFRGAQIHQGVWHGGAGRFAAIKGLPRALAARLDQEQPFLPAVEHQRQESRDGTVKALLRLQDGRLVECVSIPTSARHTVCVSSQVGCAVGCSFCASGRKGLERDLSAGEMAFQVLFHHRRRPVTHVVFMGSGEPLFNYDALLKAMAVLGEEAGLHLGRRRFTVSTAGVPAPMRQLGDDEPQVTLALSLHAADDETRSRLVPLNRRWPLAEVLGALDDYAAKVKRRPTFEYVLLADINMAPEHARLLAATALRYHAHINLIPFNPVGGTPHRPPTPEEVERFAMEVANHGGHLTLRGRRGADIDAACGQLRQRVLAPAPAPTPVPPDGNENRVED